jgi:lysophospholipase L1-like esterase
VLGLERRFDRNVANLRVAKLFLMIGANDLRYRSAEETATRVEALLARLRGSEIYVQSILPVPHGRKGVFEQAAEYNRRLEEVCRRHGYVFIDLYSSFVGKGGEMDPTLSTDGVHPNGRGHELWRSLLDRYLAPGATPEHRSSPAVSGADRG